MTYIKIKEKYFELASLKSQLFVLLVYALAYLGAIIVTWIGAVILVISVSILGFILYVIIAIIGFIFQTTWSKDIENFVWGPFSDFYLPILAVGGFLLAVVILGESIGHSFTGFNQVIRLKDGKACGLKEILIRRLTLVFQPLDIFWMFWKDQQRLGDKLARTVVVKADPSKIEAPETGTANGTQDLQQINMKTVIRAYQSIGKNMVTFWRQQAWQERMTRILRDTELLETTLREMRSRLEIAVQKHAAAIHAEKQFQSTHQKISATAEQCYQYAADELKSGRAHSARKYLERRNEFRRLARQCQKRWDEQKQVVDALSNLLVYIQQKMRVVESTKAGVDAQYTNVATAADLRETLQKLKANPLVQMEETAAGTVISSKVSTETDFEYQQAEFERKYDDHIKDESVEDELEKLKANLP